MGTFEELKGKVKEKVGEWTDNENLEAEGDAQADKGRAERDANKAKAEAKVHETKADVAELRERAAQRDN